MNRKRNGERLSMETGFCLAAQRWWNAESVVHQTPPIKRGHHGAHPSQRAAPRGTRGCRDFGRMLGLAVMIGLAMMIGCGVVFGIAVRAGIAPDFGQRIALDTQHILVIHNGPSPTCTYMPNPPQHDCFWPGPERREFSVVLLTTQNVQSLVWFRLPPR
jgi:hypothetical protein